MGHVRRERGRVRRGRLPAGCPDAPRPARGPGTDDARNSARQEALSSDNVYLQKLKTWASELPYVSFIPSHPKLLEVMPRIAANVEGAILNQWTVEEGLKKAEDEVNQILAG